MPPPVRLKDIATQAKVSVATVSLALRDSTLISAATRARVVALARTLEYRAHPYVSAYMSWRRKRGGLRHPSIALLHHYDTAEGWRKHGSSSVREMHRGVIEQIRVHGYSVEELWLKVARPRRLLEILRARAVSGLIFAPVAAKTIRYEIPWDEFSAVQIGTGPSGLELPRVVHNHYQGALDAVRQCAARGYRGPGLVIDQAHDDRLQHVWRAGFTMGVEECGFPRHSVYLMSEVRPDPPSLRAWVMREKPDVVVTNLHHMLETQLREWGFSAPQDLGLVSLSVPALGDRVTGIEQNAALIGSRATDLLAGALQLHRTGVLPEAITTLVNGRWNEGETLRTSTRKIRG